MPLEHLDPAAARRLGRGGHRGERRTQRDRAVEDVVRQLQRALQQGDDVHPDPERGRPGGERRAHGRRAQVQQRGDQVALARPPPVQRGHRVEGGRAGAQLVVDEHQRARRVVEHRRVAELQRVGDGVRVLLVEAGEQRHARLRPPGGVDVDLGAGRLRHDVAEPGRGLAVAEGEGRRAPQGSPDERPELRAGAQRHLRSHRQVLAEDPADDQLGALGVVAQGQPDQGVQPPPVRVGVDLPGQAQARLDDGPGLGRGDGQGARRDHGVSTGSGVRGPYARWAARKPASSSATTPSGSASTP